MPRESQVQLSILSVTSLLCEERQMWTAGIQLESTAVEKPMEHQQSTGSHAVRSQTVIPFFLGFGWLQTFQSLIWTRKGNLSLKGNWRTTPYWWAPLQGPLHTCSLTTSMESVHCQGFVARGKRKGRSRPPNNSYYIGGPWSSQVVLVIKNPPSNAGDIREAGSVLGLERSPGEHGNPLQFSCLENPMDRGAWQVTVHGITESQTQQKWLSRHAHGVLTMSQALGSLLDMHYYPLTIPQLGTSISMLRQGN